MKKNLLLCKEFRITTLNTVAEFVVKEWTINDFNIAVILSGKMDYIVLGG